MSFVPVVAVGVTQLNDAQQARLAPYATQCDTMYDMKNDRLFSLRMPDADLEALEQIAIDEDRTIADIVRRAIREHLESHGARQRSVAYKPPNKGQAS